MKKTKCDGKKPCSRCSQDDKICTYSEKKKHQEKLYSSSYVELLETRIDILQECLQRMVYNLANNEEVSQFVPKNKDYSINHLVDLFAKDPQSRFYGSQFNPTDISDDEGVSPVKSIEVKEEKPKRKRGRKKKIDIEREKEERIRQEIAVKEEEEEQDEISDEHKIKREHIENIEGDKGDKGDKDEQDTEQESDDEVELEEELDDASPNSIHQIESINVPSEPSGSLISQSLPPLETESPFSNPDLISPQSVTNDPNFDYRFDLGQYRSGAALAAAAITGEYNPSGSEGSISSAASSPTIESDLMPWGTVSPALLNDTSSILGYQNFSRSTDDLLASSPSASIISNRSGRQGSTGVGVAHHNNNKVHKSGSHHYHHHHHPGTSTPPNTYYGSSRLRERSRSKTGVKIPSQHVEEDIDRRSTLFSGQSRSLNSATFPISNNSIYSQQLQQIQQQALPQEIDSGLLFGDHQMGEIDDLNLGELLISSEGVFYSDDQSGLVK